MKAWVLWWRWHDDSARPTIVAVYLNEHRAREDYELVLQGHPSVDWNLTEIDSVRGTTE